MRQHRVLVSGQSGWVCAAGPGVFHIHGEPELALRLLQMLGSLSPEQGSDTVFRLLARVLLEAQNLPDSLSVAIESSDGVLLLVCGTGVARIPSPVGAETLSAVSVAMWSQRVIPLESLVAAGEMTEWIDDGSDLGQRIVEGSGFVMIPGIPFGSDGQIEGFSVAAPDESMSGYSAGREDQPGPDEPIFETQPIGEESFDSSGIGRAEAHVEASPAVYVTQPVGDVDTFHEEKLVAPAEQLLEAPPSSEPAVLPATSVPATSVPATSMPAGQALFGSVDSLGSELANFGILTSAFDPNSDLTLDSVRLPATDNEDGRPAHRSAAEIDESVPAEDEFTIIEEPDDVNPFQATPSDLDGGATPVPDVDAVVGDVGREAVESPPPFLGGPAEAEGSAGIPGNVAVPTNGSPPRERILGKSCVCGRLNSPGWPTCRTCGESLRSAELITEERPPLGFVRFSDGQGVSLDRSIVVGRHPRPMSHDGRRECDTVVVSSDGKVISRSHFELSVVGWDLKLIDRGSRNGTRVRRENNQELVLHEGESSPLFPGDVILFADQSAVVDVA